MSHCQNPGEDGIDADDDAVHGFFGLTYANYLTLPRSLMQSMPGRWQSQMVALIKELNAAFEHIDLPHYNVRAGKWCYIDDLSELELTRAGVTWCCPDDQPTGHRREYYGPDGDELETGTACVFVAGEDPVPHYNRGRTRVPRADELASVQKGQS